MPQSAGDWPAAQEAHHTAAVEHIVHLVAEAGTVRFGPIHGSDISIQHAVSRNESRPRKPT